MSENESIAETRPRNAAIDVARGLGILAVVAGHSIASEKAVVWIFAFHMPLFFFLSGYGAHYSVPAGRFLLKKARALLLPYFATIGLAFAYWWLFYRHYSHDPSPVADMLLRVARQALYATGTEVRQVAVGPVGPIWFLPALFAANLAGYAIGCAGRSRAAFLALTMAATGAGLFLGQTIFLPFSLDVALAAQAFMGIGVLAGQAALFSRPPRPWQLLLAAAAYGLSVWSGGISLNDRIYNNFLISAAGAIGGSLLVVWLAGWLARFAILRSPFAYLGRAALVILCFHTFDTGFANLDEIFPSFYAAVESDPALWIAYRLAFCCAIYETLRRLRRGFRVLRPAAG